MSWIVKTIIKHSAEWPFGTKFIFGSHNFHYLNTERRIFYPALIIERNYICNKCGGRLLLNASSASAFKIINILPDKSFHNKTCEEIIMEKVLK